MGNTLTMVADASKPLHKYHCTHCENKLIASTDVTTCPYCGDSFESNGRPVKTSFTASLGQEEAVHVKCEDCNSIIAAYHTSMTAEELSATRYCPVCGGNSLEDANVSEEESAFTDNSCKDGNCDEVSGCDESKDSDESDSVDEEFKDASEEKMDETEKDVQDTLEGKKPMPSEDLQWQTVNDQKNGEDGTLVAFSANTGNPLFIFRKSNCPKDMQEMFASTLMIQAFNHICDNEGIGNAVNKFGGTPFNSKEILESNYIDSMVEAKLYNEMLPKFIECMATVVDGAMKGIYPEVRKDINDAMGNELEGAGLPKERVEAAIRSAMGSGGTTVYATLLAKAVELMKEPETIFAKTKSMIAAAANIVDNTFDEEQQKVRETLNKSSMKIMASTVSMKNGFGNAANQSEVEKMRKRISFSIR